MTARTLRKALRSVGSPERARVSRSFFKTGPGEYGEGDVFLGVTVPETRKVASRFSDMPFPELRKSLGSSFHEERLAALLILVARFGAADAEERKVIFDFYLAHTERINNWDLVDLSADKIVGAYLEDGPRTVLDRLAESGSLWERRIAMVATLRFIRKGESKDALRIAERLLHDDHDLIRKAVGWMLREVGKYCGEAEEEAFLKRHQRVMPRTTLRYAIERFPEEKRRAYMEGRA